jgi:hypothetical protein
MEHEIHSVMDFAIVAPYTLRIHFNDESVQLINFLPMLRGALYSPWRDLAVLTRCDSITRLERLSGPMMQILTRPPCTTGRW